MKARSMIRSVVVATTLSVALAAALLAGGCAQLGYYAQAAQGQFALLAEARPIDDWLAEPTLDPRLHTKLTQARLIRRFAARELGLPDNHSYTSYADLKRPFVLWNVVATGELSMEQRKWCFPVAGCVSYRGYYHQADARQYAGMLRAEGLDVQVAGVPAYSTLGWFNDPVLSSFIHYPDGELARLIFHELAHQVVYVKDDTQFNESFATAVEEIGVERWLATQGDPAQRRTFNVFEGRKRDFLQLLLKHRQALEANYARSVGDAEKRHRKIEIFHQLQDDYQMLKAGWGGYAGYDRWFAEPLSNAHLAAVATYHDFVPGFRTLYAHGKSFPDFYAAVQHLANTDVDQRHAELAALGKSGLPAASATVAAAASR